MSACAGDSGVDDAPGVGSFDYEDASFLIRASTLSGNNLVTGQVGGMGELADLLITPEGEIEYALFNETGSPADPLTEAADWNLIEPVPVAGDISDATLRFEGVEDDVQTLPPRVDQDERRMMYTAEELGTAGQEIDGPLLRLMAIEDDDLAYVLSLNGYEARIEDTIIDLASGRVAYALVRADDLETDELRAVPWERLAYVPAENSFATDVPLSVLAGAPSIEENTQGMVDVDWEAAAVEFWAAQ